MPTSGTSTKALIKIVTGDLEYARERTYRGGSESDLDVYGGQRGYVLRRCWGYADGNGSTAAGGQGDTAYPESHASSLVMDIPAVVDLPFSTLPTRPTMGLPRFRA